MDATEIKKLIGQQITLTSKYGTETVELVSVRVFHANNTVAGISYRTFSERMNRVTVFRMPAGNILSIAEANKVGA